MDLAWLAVLGIFLFTCLLTYGLFLNADEAKHATAAEPELAKTTLPARLDEELLRVPASRDDEAEVLQQLRAQELELAEACEAKGFQREATVHRGIAATVERSLRELEARKVHVA